MLSAELTTTIDSIKRGSSRSWFGWVFFFTAMGRCLRGNYANENERQFAFISAYLVSSWLSQWWFSRIIATAEQRHVLRSVVSLAKGLDRYRLFDLNHFRYLDTFQILQTKNALTPEHIQKTQTREGRAYEVAIQLLDYADLLTTEKLTFLKDYPHLPSLVKACNTLSFSGLLNEQNFNRLKEAEDPVLLATAFSALKRNEIYKPNNCGALFMSKNLTTAVLEYHTKHGRLSQGIFDMLPVNKCEEAPPKTESFTNISK